MENYYEILGVSKDVTNDELKKVYRKLAKKFHPDANVGNVKAEETFKKISKAYEILSNETSRAKYDRELNGNFSSFDKNQKTYNNTSKKSSNINEDIFNKFNGFNLFEQNFGMGESNKTNQNVSKNPIDFTDMFENFMGMKKMNFKKK